MSRVSRCLMLLLVVVFCLVAAAQDKAAAAPTQIKVMSFNVWGAGGNVNNGFNKVVSAIQSSGADIVGLEECGTVMARDVAASLGWYHLQGPVSNGIVSRYPITQVFPITTAGMGARLRVNASPVQDVIVWVCHLYYTPYGPYDACLSGLSVNTIIRHETSSGRVGEIQEILSEMAPYLNNADSVPVFLLGDFNAPSHLDWTAAAAPLHCGYTIDWPVSNEVADAGMLDSFRVIYPDPVVVPGNTWSPIYLDYVYPDGKPEPLDRIDFVHYKGAGLIPTSSQAYFIGTPSQYPDYQNNQWPSDHAAALTAFSATLGGGLAGAVPALSLNKATYAVGESIVASFGNGPGNSTDWIGIYKTSDMPGNVASTLWLYTNGTQNPGGASGPVSGSVTFNNTLAVGNYYATFLFADGFGEMTPRVNFNVSQQANDTVDITLAEWSSKSGLHVQATSSMQPSAILTVQGFGAMTWKSNLQRYDYVKRSTPNPGTVTVTSNKGGSDTAPVVPK